MKKANEKKTTPTGKKGSAKEQNLESENTIPQKKTNYEEEDDDELDTEEKDFLTDEDEFDFDKDPDFEEFDMPKKKSSGKGKKGGMDDDFDDMDFLKDDFEDFDEDDF